MHYGAEPMVAAMCLVQMAVMAVLVLIGTAH